MRKQDVISYYLVSIVLGVSYGCSLLDAAALPAVDDRPTSRTGKSQAQYPKPPVTPYVRPFGAKAPWNTPVKGLRRHPQSDTLAHRLWHHAARRPGNFNLSFSGYTYPVYMADTAQGYYPVRAPAWSKLNGTKIPWNPSWKPASGSDSQVIILDPRNGREWDLWQASFDGAVVHVSNGNLIPDSYFTKEDGFKPSRGSGIPYLAMLVRPEEIAQGRIEHALSMPSRNTAKTFVPPATKSDGRTTENGIPMGTRFALNITDAEIDQWVDSLPKQLPAQTRRVARIIAVALRDYGWFITDTAGGAHFQFEDYATAHSKWDALGLGEKSVGWKSYPTDLLDGLITKERIYAIDPGK